jgi:hypothetical protein
MTTPKLGAMEEVERLPSVQPSGNQDALFKASGRLIDGAHGGTAVFHAARRCSFWCKH